MKKLIKKSRILFIAAPLFVLSSCMMMPFGQMGMHNGNGMNSVVDPVCGNSVVDNPIIYNYNNMDYYFDSPECLTEFRNNPGKYAMQHQSVNHHNGAWFLGGLGAGIVMTAFMVLMFL